MSQPYREDPNLVTVMITGAVNSGKTAVAAILMKALQEAGFNGSNIKVINQDNDIHGKVLIVDEVVASMKEKNAIINIIDNNGNPIQ